MNERLIASSGSHDDSKAEKRRNDPTDPDALTRFSSERTSEAGIASRPGGHGVTVVTSSMNQAESRANLLPIVAESRAVMCQLWSII